MDTQGLSMFALLQTYEQSQRGHSYIYRQLFSNEWNCQVGTFFFFLVRPLIPCDQGLNLDSGSERAKPYPLDNQGILTGSVASIWEGFAKRPGRFGVSFVNMFVHSWDMSLLNTYYAAWCWMLGQSSELDKNALVGRLLRAEEMKSLKQEDLKNRKIVNQDQVGSKFTNTWVRGGITDQFLNGL